MAQDALLDIDALLRTQISYQDKDRIDREALERIRQAL